MVRIVAVEREGIGGGKWMSFCSISSLVRVVQV